MRRLTVLIALLSSPALSEINSKTILGLEIGEPLKFPECTYSTVSGIRFYDTEQLTVCHEDSHSDKTPGVTWTHVDFPIAKAPAITKWRYVNAYISDGVIQGIGFPTAGVSTQEAVLAQLKQKFGQPTNFSVDNAQNAMGASFKTYNAVWQTSTITVTFHGALDTFDLGEVDICAKQLCAARESVENDEHSQRQGL